jgi:hypothetical protein
MEFDELVKARDNPTEESQSKAYQQTVLNFVS